MNINITKPSDEQYYFEKLRTGAFFVLPAGRSFSSSSGIRMKINDTQYLLVDDNSDTHGTLFSIANRKVAVVPIKITGIEAEIYES